MIGFNLAKSGKHLVKYGFILWAFFMNLTSGCSQSSVECSSVKEGIQNEAYIGNSLEDRQYSLGFESESLESATQIAQILRSLGIAAIFFLEGKTLDNDSGKSLFKAILDLGHRFGNIGYSLDQVEQNLNLEAQFRSVDYFLTRYQRDSNFFLKLPPDQLLQARSLNSLGLGKYIGPIGNAATGLKNLVDTRCNLGQSLVCSRELETYLTALRKGIVIFPPLGAIINVTEVISGVVNQMRQGGAQFIAIVDVPEISRDIKSRNLKSGQEVCNDYSRS